jgi:hypothetical protein
MNSKTCSVCKTDKPIDQFPVINTETSNYGDSQRQRPTHENRCRPCKAAYARAWRSKAPTNYRGSGKLKNVPLKDRLLMSAISQRLQDAKARSFKYNHPEPDVDREYLYELFQQQEGKCALSGAILKIEKRAVTCLSLDKIDPEKGYVKGNVQWVAWAVNRAKGDMATDVFLDMCKQVIENQKVQRLSPLREYTQVGGSAEPL